MLERFFKKYIDKAVDEAIQLKSTIGPLKDDTTIWRSLRSLLSAETTVSNPFDKSAWVYGAVKAISRNISRVPIKLYEEPENQKGKPATDFDVTPITSGPLFDLIMQPNFLTTWKYLIDATAVNLELYGECFWILDRKNVTELPSEIWLANPTKFNPIYNDAKVFTGWMYKKGNDEIPFAFHELVYFKFPNPYDDLRGLAPMKAAQLGIDQDHYASRYNKNFFEEGVALSGIIEVPDELTSEAYNRLLMSFEERHKGHKKAHKVALIEGGGKFVPVTPSHKDFEFTSLRKMNKEEILTAFGVNPVVVGSFADIKSYEGIRAAHRAFWLETLVPKIEYISDVINYQFIRKIEEGRYRFKFDLNSVESLREDFYRKVDAAERLYQVGFPINMINKRLDLGMDDVEWGDSWWIDQSKIPAGTQPVETPTPSEGKSYNYQSEPHTVREFDTKLRKFLFEQRKQVLNVFAKSCKDKIVCDYINCDADVKKLISYLNPVYKEALMSVCNLYPEDNDFLLQESNSDAVINSRSGNLSTTLIANITENVSEIIKHGSLNSSSPEEVMSKIKKFYNFISSKSLEISRYEVNESTEILKERLTNTCNKPIIET